MNTPAADRRKLCALFCGLMFAASALPFATANAQSIDYDPRRPTSLKPCDEQWHRGRQSEAERCYSNLLATSSDVLVQA